MAQLRRLLRPKDLGRNWRLNSGQGRRVMSARQEIAPPCRRKLVCATPNPGMMQMPHWSTLNMTRVAMQKHTYMHMGIWIQECYFREGWGNEGGCTHTNTHPQPNFADTQIYRDSGIGMGGGAELVLRHVGTGRTSRGGGCGYGEAVGAPIQLRLRHTSHTSPSFQFLSLQQLADLLGGTGPLDVLREALG